MTASVNEALLTQALVKRKAAVLANLETLTMKQLRKDLATELGVDAEKLKEYKEHINALIDQFVAEKDTEKRQAAKGKEARKHDKVVGKEGGKQGKGEKREGKKEKHSKVEERQTKENRPAPKQSSAEVERMKEICRLATIKVSPHVYRHGTEAGLAQELKALLAKHELTAKSGAHEIQAAKARLQKARELEGIDTSNIVDSGRRRRAAAAAAINYNKLAGSGSESEEEGVEEESASGTSSESEAPPAQSRGGKRRRKGKQYESESDASVYEEEAGGSEGEGEAAASGSRGEEEEEEDEEHAEGEEDDELQQQPPKQHAPVKPSPKRAASAVKGEVQALDDLEDEVGGNNGLSAQPVKRRKAVLDDLSDDDW